MSTYTCKRCSRTFESKHVSGLCPDCRVGICVVCGKEFVRSADYPNKQCCSRQCAGKWRVQTGAAKLHAQKAMKTRLEKYGTLRSDIFKEYTKVCKFCGKEFKTKSPHKVYCDGPHYGPCPICGKPSKITDLATGYVPVCSEECRQEKIRRTNQERYGVDCYFQSDEHHEKSNKTMVERYGVEHFGQTDTFKQQAAEFWSQDHPEIEEKRRNTNLDHYGVCYPMQNEEVKAKSKQTAINNYDGFGLSSPILAERIRNTNLLKYGAENPMQNKDVQAKAKQTIVERYGENPYSNSVIIEHRKETNLKKYGVEQVFQSPMVQEKIRQTNIERYGAPNAFQSEQIKEKIAQVNLERYGVVNPMQSEEIRERSYLTNLMRYGNRYFKGSDADLLRSSFDSSKLEVYKQFRDDTENFLKSYSEKPTMKQLVEDTGTNLTTVSAIIHKHDLQYLIQYVHVPYTEQEIINFLLEYIDESEIRQHDHAVIHPKELDIYLPKYNLAIECNPTYTHNSSKAAHFSDYIIPYNYHQVKTIACEEKRVRLFHLFGYQWANRPEVVKSMLLNMIGKTPEVYYARNLKIKEVSDEDSHRFLDKNHIQGYTSGKVRLGLYQGEELVSIMIFSHKRGTMGHSKGDSANDWELTRFCNKIYTRCVGGASKLFKYFVEKYNPYSVVSFSDRSNTSGGLYKVLGFEFDSYTGLGYVWVNSLTDAYYTRVACQKSKLRKLFNDPTIDIENRTESDIMEEHGFVKVYNSGLIKWIWKK